MRQWRFHVTAETSVTYKKVTFLPGREAYDITPLDSAYYGRVLKWLAERSRDINLWSLERGCRFPFTRVN